MEIEGDHGHLDEPDMPAWTASLASPVASSAFSTGRICASARLGVPVTGDNDEYMPASQPRGQQKEVHLTHGPRIH